MTVGKVANFILPVNNVLSRDLRQLPLAEIRQNFLLDNTFLSKPGVEFQLGLDVLFVQGNKALKCHIYIGLFLHQEFPFPGQRLFFGCKTAFKLLLALTPPVRVTELNIPGSVVFIFECGHI